MKLAVYQIDSERDTERLKFISLDYLEQRGHEKPDAGIYNKVFDGELDCVELEQVYYELNNGRPAGFYGHSLSVSDVVEVKEQVGDTEPGFYFCNEVGFTEVVFDAKQTQDRTPKDEIPKEKMKVVLLEPGKLARVAEIGTTLAEMQKTVGGDIEPFYPFEEDVCIIVDEEGKLKGSQLNRAVYSEDHEMIEIIAGTAFICDCSGSDFGGLNDEQLKKYCEQFKYPDVFFKMGRTIVARPYKECEFRDEAR